MAVRSVIPGTTLVVEWKTETQINLELDGTVVAEVYTSGLSAKGLSGDVNTTNVYGTLLRGTNVSATNLTGSSLSGSIATCAVQLFPAAAAHVATKVACACPVAPGTVYASISADALLSAYCYGTYMYIPMFSAYAKES